MEKKLETLKKAVRIYSQDIRMGFGAMQIVKSGKRQMTEGIELLTLEKIRTLEEKETYKYLCILEADTIKQAKMKEKNKKENHRRTRKLHETKLYNINLIKGINIRYSGQFLKWTKEELQLMDQRTRKLMTMHKILYPSDDIDFFVPRKEGGRGLVWR